MGPPQISAVLPDPLRAGDRDSRRSSASIESHRTPARSSCWTTAFDSAVVFCGFAVGDGGRIRIGRIGSK